MREASLKSAEVDLARTQIRSPVDGVVISRNMNVGQTVQASFSAPTLFQIANDLGQMEIAAMVSEADIGGVEEGQEVSFTVEAFPTRTFEGRVAQVRNQPTTNQNVVTYATIVAVPNADLKLKPGMTANVFITTAKKENVLRIPNAALRFRPPEGASVRTNVIQLASAANRGPGPAASAVATDDGSQPSGGSQASPEMRQRMLERYDKNGDGRLDEAERQAMPPGGRGRGQSGGGGGSEGGFSGGRAFSRGRPEGQSGIRTIHQVITNSSGTKSVELQPVQVRTGISDGTYTELVDGPPENTTIATGLVNEIAAAPGAATQNPFGGPFGRGRPR
jgi:HlyD family secretion protein